LPTAFIFVDLLPVITKKLPSSYFKDKNSPG
jgi:hypothetical protein